MKGEMMRKIFVSLGILMVFLSGAALHAQVSPINLTATGVDGAVFQFDSPAGSLPPYRIKPGVTKHEVGFTSAGATSASVTVTTSTDLVTYSAPSGCSGSCVLTSAGTSVTFNGSYAAVKIAVSGNSAPVTVTWWGNTQIAQGSGSGSSGGSIACATATGVLYSISGLCSATFTTDGTNVNATTFTGSLKVPNSATGITLTDDLTNIVSSGGTARFTLDTGNIAFGCASDFGCSLGQSSTNRIGNIYAQMATLGANSSSTGSIAFKGATSGTVTLTPASAAGTWTMTFPSTAGTSGYALTTNGSGVTSWTAVAAANCATTNAIWYGTTGTCGSAATLNSAGNITANELIGSLVISNTATGITLASDLLYMYSSAGASRFLFDTGNIAIGCASDFGCSLGTASANRFSTLYGNAVTLGSNGGTTGTVNLKGSTSGTVIVTPAASAGTWTMTLPSTAGTSGYLLSTNGSGVTSWIVAPSASTMNCATNNAVLVRDSATSLGCVSTFTADTGTGIVTLANLIDSALTQNRVPYAGTSKQLYDDANMTYDPSIKQLALTGQGVSSNYLYLTSELRSDSFYFSSASGSAKIRVLNTGVGIISCASDASCKLGTSTSDRWGIISGSTATWTGGTLTDGQSIHAATGTLASTDATQNGLLATVTGSGSGNTGQRTGMYLNFAAGYTGGGIAASGYFLNSNAGTGTSALANNQANYGVIGSFSAATTGDGAGLLGSSANSTGKSFGAVGIGAGSGSLSVGVAGIASAGTLKIGGVFALGLSPVVTASAALIADNMGASGTNIFVARAVSSPVVTIGSTGVTSVLDLSIATTSNTTYVSSPAANVSGFNMVATPFTGGSTTTTVPMFSIRDAGVTVNTLTTSGSILSVNTASAFAGNSLQLQSNGFNQFVVTATTTVQMFVQPAQPGLAGVYIVGTGGAGYGTTNTKPLFLVENQNATSNGWTSTGGGTLVGFNTNGNVTTALDVQTNATSRLKVNTSGVSIANGSLLVGAANGNNTVGIVGSAPSTFSTLNVTATMSSTAATQKGISFTASGGNSATTAYGVYFDTAPVFGYSVYVVGGTFGVGAQMQISSAMTSASGTPGSLCYDTVTFGVRTNNALTCTVSDEDQKTPLREISVGGLETLLKLRPAEYEFLSEFGDDKRTRYGFGAQSLQKVNIHLADGYDKFGIARAPDEYAILAITVKAVQELEMRLKALEGKR